MENSSHIEGRWILEYGKTTETSTYSGVALATGMATDVTGFLKAKDKNTCCRRWYWNGSVSSCAWNDSHQFQSVWAVGLRARPPANTRQTAAGPNSALQGGRAEEASGRLWHPREARQPPELPPNCTCCGAGWERSSLGRIMGLLHQEGKSLTFCQGPLQRCQPHEPHGPGWWGDVPSMLSLPVWQ